jgi:hypothetical protein
MQLNHNVIRMTEYALSIIIYNYETTHRHA